jgi:hypothetical protein
MLLLGSSMGTGGLVMRLFLGIAIYRGAAAARQLGVASALADNA